MRPGKAWGPGAIRPGNATNAAGTAVSERRVKERTPRIENEPSSKTAGTSVISSAANPMQVVTPEINTGATMASRQRNTASRGSPPTRTSSSKRDKTCTA